MKVIRGAIVCENTEQSIWDGAVTLINDIVSKNSLSHNNMSVIVFSATDDLDATYPATGVRKQLGLTEVPMMCLSEMKVKNSLRHCLRVAVFTNLEDSTKVKHCYLNGAEVLRPDLCE